MPRTLPLSLPDSGTVVTHGEAAQQPLERGFASAVSPCVTDDRAGGRRVPPNTPAAPPSSELEQLLRRVGDDVVVQPRLTLVRSARAAPDAKAKRLRACALDRLRPAGVVDLYERHVFAALKGVAKPERECIELTYFDGLGVAEIAACCGLSPEAVQDRLRRGLDEMLRYLRACALREAAAGNGGDHARSPSGMSA